MSKITDLLTIKEKTMSKITEENYFAKLAKISVNEHCEKKGKFTYLSWAWAVDVLRKEEPTATWEVIRFNGLPFLETKCGYFVEVAVSVRGITLSQIHPVLNNNQQPISSPNSFQINTSIQRALVKAIALHGIGLYIYAGEDLPEGEEKPEEKSNTGLPPAPINQFSGLAETADEDMKATLKAGNEECFRRLKKLIEETESLEGLEDLWELERKNIAKLKKYAVDLYDMIVSSAKFMKSNFDKVREMDNFGNKMGE